MPRLFILGPPAKAQTILDWLAREGAISSHEVTAIVEYYELPDDSRTDVSGVPLVGWDTIKGTVIESDLFLVAGERFRESVGELFSLGVFNVFDGEAVVSRESVHQRFLRIAENLYIGPNVPNGLDPHLDDFLRYTAEPLDAGNIPSDKLFIVNSLPKSGTVWMMAMLEGILGVKSKRQITLSHVFDIRSDWGKPNNHGAVVLVRDMRDVVVSWFHDVARSDQQNGFSSPRYGDVESFYFEHLLGRIFANARYGFGKLEEWIDFVSAKGFPIVKYEDMVADTQSGLRKVMNSWKIRVSDESFGAVARDYSFDKMQATVSSQEGFVSDMLRSRHMRKGRVGSWKEELPEEVAAHISETFSGYQRRLKYE